MFFLYKYIYIQIFIYLYPPIIYRHGGQPCFFGTNNHAGAHPPSDPRCMTCHFNQQLVQPIARSLSVAPEVDIALNGPNKELTWLLVNNSLTKILKRPQVHKWGCPKMRVPLNPPY
jgi:hypothetical protein